VVRREGARRRASRSAPWRIDASVFSGTQARAPAPKRRGSLPGRRHRMGETGILSSRATGRDRQSEFPSHADARANRAPDEVDDRLTGLSGARSEKRRVIPEDTSLRHGPVHVSSFGGPRIRDLVPHGRAAVPDLKRYQFRLCKDNREAASSEQAFGCAVPTYCRCASLCSQGRGPLAHDLRLISEQVRRGSLGPSRPAARSSPPPLGPT
jgi:hypothetical protein